MVLLEQVLSAVPDTATTIVQADHGGHEQIHGTDSPEDMTIPWMIMGPNIRKTHIIKAPVSLLSTAPTVAHILGIAPHNDWEGKIIDEAFIAFKA